MIEADVGAEPEWGAGIDMESVDRFAGDIGEFMSGVYSRLFSESEHLYCVGAADPAIAYAAIWCLKEAALKALWQWIRLDPRRIIVNREDGAELGFLVDGQPLAALNVEADISLTESSGLVVAVVLTRRIPRQREDSTPVTSA